MSLADPPFLVIRIGFWYQFLCLLKVLMLVLVLVLVLFCCCSLGTN